MTIKSFITVRSVLWCLLSVLCFFQSMKAQSYITDIRKLSVEDGLSSRFVNTVYKDSQGFIWIGTEYGLNRYDGYIFKIYTAENSALTSSIVRELYEDSEYRLWIIQKSDPEPGNHIDILDMQTGSIHSFEQLFKDIAPFKSMDIKQVYPNAGNDLWITTLKGDVYHYHNNRFELISATQEPVQRRIFYIDDEFLWMQAILKNIGKKLLKIDMQGRIRDTLDLKYNAKSRVIDKNDRTWLFQARQKRLIQATTGKECLKSIDLRHLGLPEAVFDPDISIDRRIHVNTADELIWWYQKKGASSRVFIFHPRKGIIIDLQPEIEALETYEHQFKSLYFDAENRAWLVTEDGIFIITLKRNKFTTLLSGEAQNYSVRGIAEDDRGVLYINTYRGRIQLHPETGELKKEKDTEAGLGITRDKQGNIWFSGRDIEKYDPLVGQSQYYIYPSGANHPPPWMQWTIIRDKTGRVWMGSQGGLYFLEPGTGLYQKFTQYNTFSQFEESTVYHLYEDKKGIWAGTSSGLYLLEPGKGITARYAKKKNAPFYIPHNYILHFHRDASGTLWLATKGGGLIRFNPEDGSYRQFTTAEGLSNNIIYAVYEDDYGKLWLSSNYGLMQFDKENFQVSTWLTGDGIAHNEFNTASHYQADDGKLYFGGLSGVTVLDPADFTEEISAPAPLQMIHCMVLNGKTGALTDKTTSVLTSGKLTLSPSDRSFIIQFALLNYENSQQNSYAYKIEGLDKDWTAIEENSLRINALPYGSYVLQIKGKGIKGQSSANELAVAIVVHKPFYLKNGFILACIFVLVLLTYGLFRWRLQNLKQAKIRLQQTVRARTQELQEQKDKMEALNATQSRWFTNIAHELRTPLTLILGPIRQYLKMHSGKSKAGIENIQLAEKNSMGLLGLVNEILDVSRLESNQLKLNKKTTNLSRLIRASTAHFESMAHQKGVSLTTHITEDIDMNIDKDRIQKILINLISNALKFTHADGKVIISVMHKEEKGIEISVADTGDGIPEKDLPHIFERYYQAAHPRQLNQGGAGIGLALSLELARLHSGDLQAESQPGKGSVFTLSLPQTLVISYRKRPSAQTITTLPPTLPGISLKSYAETANSRPDKPLILLVEDNPDMRQYILGFMSRNYKIMEAADGLEALKTLKEITPDLIISDIMMPRMDGISLAKRLKEDARLKNIPFITLTAKAGESDKIATLRIGVDDYLTKPFNAEELEARATNLIRNSKERTLMAQTDPDEITAPSYQEKQLAEMKEFVMSRLNDNSLSVNDLAASRNMSPSSLTRLLKKATGLNPSQFIREIRLQQARRLLEAKQYPTVLEVVYAIGFEKASHFTKLFSERFGKKPSEYL